MTDLGGVESRERCAWAGSDPEYVRYHDEEWGYRLHGDQHLFEKLSLEAFQAGLSWITILRRRAAFREVFHGFEIARVAGITAEEIETVLGDARIIRNRAKIEATVSNAKIALELTADSPGALDELMWSFAPEASPRRLTLNDVPAVTVESSALSSALRALGFRFVGPTTMYALMQSVGMVDDHVESCWRSSS